MWHGWQISWTIFVEKNNTKASLWWGTACASTYKYGMALVVISHNYTTYAIFYLYICTIIITNDGPHPCRRKCWEDVVPVSWTPSPVHPPWAIEKVPQVVRALFNSLCAMSCRTTVAHWCPESLPTPATGQGWTMTHTCWPFTPDVGAVTFQESMPLAIDIASW